MIFKCKNCGGNAVYHPEKKKMWCPHCDSEDSEERLDSVHTNASSVILFSLLIISAFPPKIFIHFFPLLRIDF